MSRNLPPAEERIYNQGERLIPGVSHGVAELVRHRSSYLFFKRVIALDSGPKTILDLGCGVGHGCVALAELPDTEVLGIDSSAETIAWARDHYARSNVRYEVGDIPDRVHEPFDYMVARGSLEHVPDGIRIIADAAWRKRLIFDVPYGENAGVNEHHEVHHITEADMLAGEIFYEDLNGTVHAKKPTRANLIGCVLRRDDLASIAGLDFPIPAWKPRARRDRLRLRAEQLRAQIASFTKQ